MGDTLNIMYLYNQEFIRLADEIINPRYSFISHNDGECNSDFIHSRDTIINANSLKGLYEYTPEQIAKIQRLQAMDNEADILDDNPMEHAFAARNIQVRNLVSNKP